MAFSGKSFKAVMALSPQGLPAKFFGSDRGLRLL